MNQNPWTSFDPEGLDPAAISAQEYALCDTVSRAFAFKAKFDVDADGYGGAYNPNGSPPGADSLKSATDKAGNLSPSVLVFQNGVPYIQMNGPFKGYFLSKTSLQDPTLSVTDPARYVNAWTTPYVVYPSGDYLHPISRLKKETDASWQKRLNVCGVQYRSGQKMSLGDIGIIAYLPNRKSILRWTPVVFADTGPRRGEAAEAVARAIGIDANPNSSPLSSISNRVVYIGFPGSAYTPAWPVSNAEIETRGTALFNQWGRASGYQSGTDRVMVQYFGQLPRSSLFQIKFHYLQDVHLR